MRKIRGTKVDIKNSKQEMQSPKQIRMSKTQNSKQIRSSSGVLDFLRLRLF